MKRIALWLLFFVMFAVSQGLCQLPYEPFPTTSAWWLDTYFLGFHDHTGAGFTNDSCDLFHLAGDTILDSISYKKIKRYTPGVDTINFYAGLREDSGLIFMKRYHRNSEELIYDFRTPVGDTGFVVLNSDTIRFHKYLKTDTTLFGLERNLHHIRILDNQPYYRASTKWIEGIGGVKGFHHYNNTIRTKILTGLVDVRLALFRLTWNRPDVYCENKYEEDFPFAVEEIDKQREHVQITFLSDVLRITNSKRQDLSIRIVDLRGASQQVLRSDQESLDISLADWQAGYYIVQITGTDTPLVINKRFVKM